MFLLFAGLKYYPAEGWRDYRGEYTSLEEAKTAALRLSSMDWIQIVDYSSKTIVLDIDKFPG